MIYLNKPVSYLVDTDFDKDGNLINKDIQDNLPVVIMIQASWCGYCTQMKPDFQEFANEMKGKVVACTIQVDGKEPGEKELGDRIKVVSPDLRGFPDVVGYKNGKFVKVNEIGRKKVDLIEFANSL